MGDSKTEEHDVEHEELLEGQIVFKGPRLIKKNLLKEDKSKNQE